MSTKEESECEAFCDEHMRAESVHLALMEAALGPTQRTRLVPLWRLAGFHLGFIPALLLGPSGLYATVEPVESFVVEHYSSQIGPLEDLGSAPALSAALRVCCEDEVHHRDDASARCVLPSSPARDAWSAVVRWGSIGAAHAARLM